MRYADIYPFDISNGKGIRVSLFVQGCDKHCKGCFNSETWDFRGGKEYDYNAHNYLMSLCDHEWISGLSILGGEPLNWQNGSAVVQICQQFKRAYPNKTIWLWTGNDFQNNNWLLGSTYPDGETYLTFKEMLDKYVDVIVDGPFIEEQKNLSLKWRGSSNQKIWINKGGIWTDETDNT